VTAVRQVINSLQERYEVRRRAKEVPSEPAHGDEAEAIEQQTAFEWSGEGSR
jgi:hypothetical protein